MFGQAAYSVGHGDHYTDDDVPQVMVMFGAGAYTVAEGDMVTVTVTLSADPERTVVIPLTHTPQGGATSADYSGVPQNVTFNTGDMSHVADDHLHGGAGHGQRRWGEREAGHRRATAGGGDRGDSGHDPR